MQRRAAEEQHGGHHGLGAAVGNDGARDHAGDRAVDHLARARLAHLAEVLPYPVEDDHRLVHRVTEHRQHRGEHGQGELPLEEGEKAEDDHHVVQVGDDAGEAEAPLEAHPQVQHDADRGDEQRKRAVLDELLADLRTDELHAAQLCAARLAAQSLDHFLRKIGARLVRLEVHADQHVARGAEVLYFGLVPGAIERAADGIDVRRLLVAHLDQRAAGELDRVVEAAVQEKEHRQQERDQRDHVERERVAHERDRAADLEEFHALAHFHAVLPIDSVATRRRWP